MHYDIIGDIHGHADALHRLLAKMDYKKRGGIYAHEKRKVIFVGDFIDRGPAIRETLETVRAMVEAGNALATMGNHEFNFISYSSPAPGRVGEFLRKHSPVNDAQTKQTREQLSETERTDCVAWFKTLPMWLDLGGLRVIHACWDQALIDEFLTLRGDAHLRDEDFISANTKGSRTNEIVEVLLKGKEVLLPEGTRIADKEGHERREMRVRWFRAPLEDETLHSFAFPENESVPKVPLAAEVRVQITPYPESAPPVFFGHYWLVNEKDIILSANAACLDMSVANGKELCAYRWSGESELSWKNVVRVNAIESAIAVMQGQVDQAPGA